MSWRRHSDGACTVWRSVTGVRAGKGSLERHGGFMLQDRASQLEEPMLNVPPGGEASFTLTSNVLQQGKTFCNAEARADSTLLDMAPVAALLIYRPTSPSACFPTWPSPPSSPASSTSLPSLPTRPTH